MRRARAKKRARLEAGNEPNLSAPAPPASAPAIPRHVCRFWEPALWCDRLGGPAASGQALDEAEERRQALAVWQTSVYSDKRGQGLSTLPHPTPPLGEPQRDQAERPEAVQLPAARVADSFDAGDAAAIAPALPRAGCCWVCGPADRHGQPQEPAGGAIAEDADGFSGWAQHKAFACPHKRRMGKGGKRAVRPEEVAGEAAVRALVQGCSVVVGLHPDMAAGDLVDFALAMNKPFAVVPCCTFHETFRFRRLRSGAPVRSHAELVQWLVEKDPEQRTQVGDLGLAGEGRGAVVFRTGG